MKPDISGFILGSLVEAHKYIAVADGSFVTVKQTGEVQIEIHEENRKPFIATIYKVILGPYLCDQLFPL